MAVRPRGLLGVGRAVVRRPPPARLQRPASRRSRTGSARASLGALAVGRRGRPVRADRARPLRRARVGRRDVVRRRRGDDAVQRPPHVRARARAGARGAARAAAQHARAGGQRAALALAVVLALARRRSRARSRRCSSRWRGTAYALGRAARRRGLLVARRGARAGRPRSRSRSPRAGSSRSRSRRSGRCWRSRRVALVARPARGADAADRRRALRARLHRRVPARHADRRQRRAPRGAVRRPAVAALVLWPRRRTALLLLAPFLLWWQWNAAVQRRAHRERRPERARRLLRAAARPRSTARSARAVRPAGSRSPSRACTGRRATSRRRSRSRAAGSASSTCKVNPLFYASRRSAAAHRRRLPRLARPHGGALGRRARTCGSTTRRKDEARLIARRPAVPETRVARRALAPVRGRATRRRSRDPPARVIALGTDSLTLAVPRPATVGLRVRWTPVLGGRRRGDACVEPRDGDWTRLRVRRAGPHPRWRPASRSRRIGSRSRTLRGSHRREQRVTPVGCGASP